MRPGFQGPVTDSTISIAELLDVVNQYFPDILPEDMLKHYGYEQRPDGVLGEDALYQDRMQSTLSGREAFAQVLDSVATDGADRLTIQRYRDAAKAMDEQERKLNEINAQIREITYGTGEQDSTKLRELRLEASKARNRAKLYEDQLTKLEHSQPYQKMMGTIGRNGAVNAVGAAAVGFDTLSSMEYEYGNLPEGENAVRDDTLPKSTNGKDKVSLTARTVKGAKVTPDDFVDLLDKDVVEGGLSYIPIFCVQLKPTLLCRLRCNRGVRCRSWR